MKLKPVEKTEAPAYPTRAKLLTQGGGVLDRHLPPRWRPGRGVAGAAGALLLASQMTGCGGPAAGSPPPLPEPIVEDAAEWTRSLMAPAPPAAAPARPSRAAFMGFLISPLPRPSEGEAMQILGESGVDVPATDDGGPT